MTGRQFSIDCLMAMGSLNWKPIVLIYESTIANHFFKPTKNAQSTKANNWKSELSCINVSPLIVPSKV